MFKEIYGKFNSVTDFVTRLDFWTRLALSIISSGAIAYMWNVLLYAIIFIFTFAMIAFIENWLRSKRKKIQNPEQETHGLLEHSLDHKESKEEKDISPVYLSLQEAANFLAKETQFTREKLQWIARFPGDTSIKDIFWKRNNPDKAHKDTLDHGTTIPLINLCLHMFRQINSAIYGTRPSFSNRDEIPYEEINYFDADYKKLYSNIARDSGSLIYNDVGVMKDDLMHAIKNTDLDALIASMNQI